MKQILISIIILVMANGLSAQCTDFGETVALDLLDTEQYMHDGYLNTMHLSQGENIDLIKSFFKGNKYRIVVVGESEVFNHLEFKLVNSKRVVVYDNKQDDYIQVWDFEPARNENMILSVHIPENVKQPAEKKGCIAILIGMKQP